MTTLKVSERANDSTAVTRAAAAPSVAQQYHARLLMCDGERYCALTEDGAVWVKAADGCLMRPRVGDLALVSVCGASGYVLAVLERAQPEADVVLGVAGCGVRLEARRVAIAADEDVTLESGAHLGLCARHADMQFETLAMEGKSLHARWTQRTEINTQRIDIADRSECHWGYSVRRIATHEDVTAASLRQLVTRDWSVSAGTAAVLGRHRAVIDADSVQIG